MGSEMCIRDSTNHHFLSIDRAKCDQNARSWGASTPMKMCIQADLDDADALRHMNKNNSERAVCITHPLAPVSTSFLFVFDTEWVMSIREHQGRDIVL